MATKLFVAGLSYAMTDDALRSLFTEYGDVDSSQIITDRETGRSKGFGFVEFADDTAAQAAIAGLNGKDMDGRPLTVNIAKPREDRPKRPFNSGNNFRRDRR